MILGSFFRTKYLGDSSWMTELLSFFWRLSMCNVGALWREKLCVGVMTPLFPLALDKRHSNWIDFRKIMLFGLGISV